MFVWGGGDGRGGEERREEERGEEETRDTPVPALLPSHMYG